MKKIDSASEMLKYLDKNEIKYIVLRGYIPSEEIDKSKDVDIYIDKKHKKKVDKLMKKNGWYTPKINCSRYPHKQYIYLTKKGLKKIDIVYGLYYGNELLKLDNPQNILKNNRCISNISIIDEDNAIKTFILHIIFDKKELSKKNKNILELMYKEAKNTNCIYYKIATELLKSKKEKSLNIIKRYNAVLKKEEDLSYNIVRYYHNKINLFINNVIKFFISRIAKKNICIIGVDGTGKSTTCEKLKAILDEKSAIKYMGFKNYELSITKKMMKHPLKSNADKIKTAIILYIEMWNRYLKYRFTKNIIIFDRYPDEMIINSKGIGKKIYIMLFNVLFPKPKLIYYQFCNVETSFQRKDDIDNREQFEKMKKQFDDKYLNNKKVKSFSSDKYNNEQIIDAIIDDINKKMLKYLV